MKKRFDKKRFSAFVLAVVMVFTSAGMAFASEEEYTPVESEYAQEECYEVETETVQEVSYEAETEFIQEESYEAEAEVIQEESYEAETEVIQEESYEAESAPVEEETTEEETSVEAESETEEESQAFEGQCGDQLTWSVNECGQLTISGYGPMYNYDMYNMPEWYEIAQYINKVEIAYGVTSIGSYAFAGCTAIVMAEIPESVTSIGAYAFANCVSLSVMVYPENIQSVDETAFSGCVSLKYEAEEETTEAEEITETEEIEETAEAEEITETEEIEETAEAEEIIETEENVEIIEIVEAEVIAEAEETEEVTEAETAETEEIPADEEIEEEIEEAEEAVELMSEITGAQDLEIENNSSYAEGETTNNSNKNQYEKYASAITSYLAETTENLLMRVEGTGSAVLVEYLNVDGTLNSSLTIANELPGFVGFLDGAENYYLVFSQLNPTQSEDVEVLRVVKYSKSWERIDSCSMCGFNTTSPVSAGSLRMDESNGMLYIHTCHQMYVSYDGQYHQANMSFEIYTSTMTIKNANYGVGSTRSGYVSHSFNQFVQVAGGKVYRLDHGDAYPRGIVLTAYNETTGNLNNPSVVENVYAMTGVAGDTYTSVSVGGMEVNSDNVIIAFNEDYGTTRNYRNIRVAAVDTATLEKTFYDVTDYEAGSGITCKTPQLVQLADGSMLLMWMEYERSTNTNMCAMVNLDSNGVMTTEIVRRNINLSDCQPILLADGSVAWYVTNGTYTYLYRINPYNLQEINDYYACNHTLTHYPAVAPTCTAYGNSEYYYCRSCKKAYSDVQATVEIKEGSWVIPVTGHSFNDSDIVNGIANGTCTQCGEHISANLPTKVKMYWKSSANSSNLFTNSFPTNTPIGSVITYYKYVNGDEAYQQMVIECSDPSIIDFGTFVGEDRYTATVKNSGTATITVYALYNPSARKEYTITVGEEGRIDIQDAAINLAFTRYSHTGREIKPGVTVKYNNTAVPAEYYTVRYENNVAVGTGRVIIEGKDVYTGSVVKEFSIIHSLAKTEGYAATCTEEGMKDFWYCKKCGKCFLDANGENETTVNNLAIAKKAHTIVSDKAVAAACTTSGLTAGSHCSACGQVFTSQRTIAALGHDFANYVSNNNAGCETDGTETAKCSRCTATSTRTIVGSKTGHSYVTEAAVEATCETAGKTAGIHCENCGKVVQKQTAIPALGHEFTNYVSDNNAECEADGTETAKCSRCAVTSTRTVIDSKLGHTVVVDEAVEATYTETGLTEGSHCSVCNKVIAAQEEIPMLLQVQVINLTAANAASGVSLSWSATDSAAGFEIFRREETSDSYTSIGRTSTTSYTDRTASNNVYFYKVRAYTNDGTKNIYHDFCEPVRKGFILQAKDLTATATISGIRLTWSEIAGTRGYQIYRRLETESSFTYIGAGISTSYTDTTADSNNVYVYMIRGYNKSEVAGDVYYGTFSAPATCTYINQVKDLTAAATETGVRLTWTTIAGTRGYQIYRRLESESSFRQVGTSMTGSFNDTSAENGNTYVYMVRGYNKTAADAVYYGIFSASVTVAK